MPMKAPSRALLGVFTLTCLGVIALVCARQESPKAPDFIFLRGMIIEDLHLVAASEDAIGKQRIYLLARSTMDAASVASQVSKEILAKPHINGHNYWFTTTQDTFRISVQVFPGSMINETADSVRPAASSTFAKCLISIGSSK